MPAYNEEKRGGPARRRERLMVFISWNVNGLRACMKKGFADFYRDRTPDFLCLLFAKQPNSFRLAISDWT